MNTLCRRWRLLLCALPLSAVAEEPVDEIQVVGTSPLGESPVAGAAGNVQVVDGEELRRQQALDLTELINRNLGSVFVNEAQGNPLQPDVTYRGFVGSPLLGLPQGIAVYQDGIRINEPFGDTVNWALLPNAAVERLEILPGSDPVFGLNALGGTIAVKTLNGFDFQGARGEAFFGSFGRFGAEAAAGNSIDDSLAWFASLSWLEEDGWRDFSGTRALQGFGSVAWQSDTSSVEAKVTLGDTTLTGNGAAPVQLLEADRSAVFTHPDDSENSLAMVQLIGSHGFSEAISLRGSVYFRRSDIDTLNGDDSDYEACDIDPGFICLEDELAFDRGGNAIPADDRLEGATVNRTATRQDGSGLVAQLNIAGSVAGSKNELIVGVAYDESDIDFTAGAELGALDDSRGAIPGGVFVGDADTLLRTETRNASVFFADHQDLGDRLQFGIGGRFNRTDVELHDQLGTALDGDHAFNRFNPFVSLNYRAGDSSIYLRYSESSRVPSPVELTCADPDDPCRLPNAFLADPPLDMVVAQTWELGVRHGGETLTWHAGAFRTINDDDIIFISAGALTNEGYFDNVGRTRRMGIELNANGHLGDSVEWFANYTWLEATFRDDFSVSSPNNPAAIDGEIAVARGDRLPALPEHLFKAGITWAPTEDSLLGLDLQVNSEQYLRGDEGNDGETIPGYVVLNAYGSWNITDTLRLFLNVNNVLDTDYETFGLFGEPDEVLGDDFDDSRFLAPGAPRGVWAGIELSID